jgi:putative spermidine/putrescine transport system permease protein
MPLPAWASPLDYALRILLWVFCGLVFLFLLAPILVVLPLSFNVEPYFSYPMAGTSLRWYASVIGSPAWQKALQNSFMVGTLTMILATVLGTLAALGLTRAQFPLKAFILGTLISPMVAPIVITAVAMYFFYAKVGLTNSFTGLVIAHTALATPFVVIIVSATLAGFDTRLARAATSLGAPPLTAFFTVTMPLILPGLISGALFAFVTSFDEVVTVIFLAGVEQYTLPREMWKGVREELNPTILAVACLMVALSVVALTLMEFLRRRAERLRGQYDTAN